MAKLSKRMGIALEKVEALKEYELMEAVSLAKSTAQVKFDESMDVAVRLSVDSRKADQNIRGSVLLPRGTGKKFRILVFAKGEKEAEAREAGAEFVGGEDLLKKIQGGWLAFDRVVATPDMMGAVGKVAKILGPRGLMPNPKLGTVTPDVETAVKAAKGGEVTFRAEKAGVIHAGIGKASFSEEQLSENLRAFVKAISNAKPSGAKGTYIKKVFVSSTMGPGLSVEIGSATGAA